MKCNKEFERLKELTGLGPEYCQERENLVEILKDKGWRAFKINLPDCSINYLSGNGEGIFVLFNPEDADLYETDTIPVEENMLGLDLPRPLYVVTLNFSSLYPAIGYGYVIECEWRRDTRAVIAWDIDKPKISWISRDEVRPALVTETYAKMGILPYSVKTIGTECPSKYVTFNKYVPLPDFFPERACEESELRKFKVK